MNRREMFATLGAAGVVAALPGAAVAAETPKLALEFIRVPVWMPLLRTLIDMRLRSGDNYLISNTWQSMPELPRWPITDLLRLRWLAPLEHPGALNGYLGIHPRWEGWDGIETVPEALKAARLHVFPSDDLIWVPSEEMGDSYIRDVLENPPRYQRVKYTFTPDAVEVGFPDSFPEDQIRRYCSPK